MADSWLVTDSCRNTPIPRKIARNLKIAAKIQLFLDLSPRLPENHPNNCIKAAIFSIQAVKDEYNCI